MTEQHGESSTETRPKLAAWQIALLALAALVVIVAGGAGLALLFPASQPSVGSEPPFPTLAALIKPASATPPTVFPTFALPTQTDVPAGTPTLPGALPDLSAIAGAW